MRSIAELKVPPGGFRGDFPAKLEGSNPNPVEALRYE
jgi:hypothetical protein